MQGAATSVYAATASELSGKSGAYLQDCKIAQPNAQARDAQLAQKLWTVTQQQIDEALDIAAKRTARLNKMQKPNY